MKQHKAFIFDLDGVIVDTAHFHFLAWKKTAAELGFELTEALNEKLKGVSRIDSLQKILDWAGVSITTDKFNALTREKNEDYLAYVNTMNKNDILPGVYSFISKLKADGYPMALGSASKNAPAILDKVGLLHFFDTIVDGNSVTKAKPDPEVFLVAAEQLGVNPHECIVFEDSEAGIEAANAAGMVSIGLGSPEVLHHADYVFPDFNHININFVKQIQPKVK